MILSMGSQVKLFLFMILLGVITGFIYDLIRTLRKIIKHNNFMIQIENFLFWILISTGIFFMILNKNSGQIRGFCIIGVFSGMILYSMLFSFMILKILVSLSNFFMRIILNAIKIIFGPVRLLIKILSGPLNFIKKNLYMLNHYVKIKLKRALDNIKIIFKKI